MNNFAIISHRQGMCGYALLLYVKTTIPCHLTCYSTFINPQRHLIAQTIRGVEQMKGAYFCFDPMKSTAQFEAGDTLDHNFYIDTWSKVKPGWYVFKGTVSGVTAPSVSPIFPAFNPPEAPLTNGGFEEWTNPLIPPPAWYAVPTGAGTATYHIETVNPKSGLQCVRLKAVGVGTQSQLKQYFCVKHLRGKTVTFDLWYRGGGLIKMWLYIPDGKSYGLNSGGTSAWRKTTRTFSIGPSAIWGWLEIASRCQSGTYSQCFFDSITLN